MINCQNELARLPDANCPLSVRYWIYSVSRRILDRVFVGSIVNIRSECHFHWFMGNKSECSSRDLLVPCSDSFPMNTEKRPFLKCADCSLDGYTCIKIKVVSEISLNVIRHINGVLMGGGGGGRTEVKKEQGPGTWIAGLCRMPKHPESTEQIWDQNSFYSIYPNQTPPAEILSVQSYKLCR